MHSWQRYTSLSCLKFNTTIISIILCANQVGTAGTFMGVSRYLKSKNGDIKCFAVEPKGAEPIAGKPVTKPLHLLQGSGYASVPDLFKFDVLDGTLRYNPF